MPIPTTVLTRRQYVDNAASHEAYYAQFVTEETLRVVEKAFGLERLREALVEDPHLNTIPLNGWDAIAFREGGGYRYESVAPRSKPFHAIIPFNRALVLVVGDTITRSTLICIAKRAARMLVERENVQLAQRPLAKLVLA